MNLPEPHGYTGPVGVNAVAIFTAEQVRAYGEECARMERERIAGMRSQFIKLAEAVEAAGYRPGCKASRRATTSRRFAG